MAKKIPSWQDFFQINFLTIHGRSSYPGLNIWARNTGQRFGVEIPPGYNLLVQAGKQLEHITGELIKAGFHEVVVNDKTLTVSDSDAFQGLCILNDGRCNSQIDLSSKSLQLF